MFQGIAKGKISVTRQIISRQDHDRGPDVHPLVAILLGALGFSRASVSESTRTFNFYRTNRTSNIISRTHEHL